MRPVTKKVAVVLFNLGGPDSLKAVRPFLFNLFNDRAIIDLPQPLRWGVATLISSLRDKTAQEIYAHMGGASPLLKETEAQSAAISEALLAKDEGVEFKTFIAMRYWKPFVKDAAMDVALYRPDEVVLMPLYPQYSTTTTGSSFDAWRKFYRGPGVERAVCCYPDHDGLMQAHAVGLIRVLQSVDLESVRVIFSAHGLPEKIIAGGDPYQHQIERSVEALAAKIGSTNWRISYQSRVGPMKWIGPSTIEAIEEAGRDRVGVVVVPIAFVSEHSETLVELDRDYRDLAMRAGVPLYLRAPAVGVEPAFVGSVADMVLAALGRDGLSPGSASCRGRFPKCPFQNESKAA